jgi:hypothetical protein
MSAFGDPATQMAFAVHENKGVFALLLGSGLSRAAEIPTGWEITTDLVRRVATAQGVEEQGDWGKWYVEAEGKEPNYSELLAQLAVTPAERRAILHGYIEPDDEDREEGRKVPTAGHKAIAKLVRDGYVKVIVTTNFDRLMENALREVGVEPTVITSPDVLQGAEPLTHSNCYILKVHGDYKDARILNTDDELNAYPENYNVLLDRIFDEHGLIVCGWSGEWDHALRAAISRAPNRRYPLFWATRGDLKGHGADLCSARQGVTVPMSDADSFLTRLVEQVETLSLSKRQNPVGVDMLVSRAKRYLAKTEHRIQLSDLISEEVARIIERLDQEDMGTQGKFSAEEFQRRVAVYEGSTEGLAKVCGLVGRWGDDTQVRLVVDAVRAIVDHAESTMGGLTTFLNMRRYPAVLAYQACALGMVRGDNWSQLHAFMGIEIDTGYDGRMRMIDAVSPSLWKGDEQKLWQNLPDYERRYTPLSDHLTDTIFNKWGKTFLSSTVKLSSDVLLLEMLTAFRYMESAGIAELRAALDKEEHGDRNFIWVPIRRAGWDRDFRQSILPKFENSEFVETLARGGFGRTDSEYIALAVENHNRVAAKMNWRF